MLSLFYSLALKISYLVVILPTILVVITALLSANEMGGTLGQGLKKLAIGSITHTILIATYILLEQGYRGILNESIIKFFFLFSGLFGAIFLGWGYLQIYKITKKLKLFTI